MEIWTDLPFYNSEEVVLSEWSELCDRDVLPYFSTELDITEWNDWGALPYFYERSETLRHEVLAMFASLNERHYKRLCCGTPRMVLALYPRRWLWNQQVTLCDLCQEVYWARQSEDLFDVNDPHEPEDWNDFPPQFEGLMPYSAPGG